jgi:hypothetical protein
MANNFFPTATNAEYWSYTAGAMAEFLQDALDSGGRLRWADLPVNVYREALAFLSSALDVAAGDPSANSLGQMGNYKAATDAVLELHSSSPSSREDVDASLRRYLDLIEVLHAQDQITDEKQKDAVTELKGFFEQIASDGERMAYAEVLQYEPVRTQFHRR